MDYSRLSMPLGEAMFTQRSIRRFRPDPIPMDDLRLIVEAAAKAPNGGNRQIARILLVNDAAKIREFGPLYREAWWAKRYDGLGWRGPEDVPPGDTRFSGAMRLADEMKDAPAVAFILAVPPGSPDSVLLAAQNLMLAARALGIGSVPTTLHEKVMDRFNAMFGIPPEISFHFCIPLGYPAGNFGPTKRMPTAETTWLNGWGQEVPWA